MKLLQPFDLHSLRLNNRVVMAPMTRSRANQHGIVGDLTVKYYTQRATAGLIITEGINISEQALGSPLTPGIWNDEQVVAWSKVTAAVHAAGGKIYAQLWHTGRVGHSVDKDGQLPVAPSAIAIEGQQQFTSQGPKAFEVPRALSTDEVKSVVADYKHAAENAKKAGFDGVELHGAFGYLPNQFLVDSSNKRSDEYGGTIENRARFVKEVMEALCSVYTDGQVGIKLSPTIPYNGMIDSDPLATFTKVIEELNKLNIAYIQLMQPMFPIDAFPHWPKDSIATFGPLVKSAVIANGGYDRAKGEAELERGIASAVSYGAMYVSNPDLVKRFEKDAPLNAPDRATFYGGGEAGYTDYPFLSE